jgi:PAS domain-containing protein
MREALNGKEIVLEEKFQIVQEDFYFNIRMLPTLFEDGTQGVTWIIQNITEHKQTEEQIQNLAKFPSENPNPVLRIEKDGKIKYANTAGFSLLSKWNREIGETAPHKWRQRIGDTFSLNERKEFEAEHNGRYFSFVLVPVKGAGYVNIYGRDVTERKMMEEALKETNLKLRERIKELTFLYKAISEMQITKALEDLGPKLVEFLVPAMQFPDITVPMVEIEGKRFTHQRYKEDLTHSINAEIRVGDRKSGRVTVYYTENRPFIIPQEQNMLNALAESLSVWITHLKD